MSRFDRRLKPEFVNKNVGVMSHGINNVRQVPRNRARQVRQARQARQVNTIKSNSPRPGTADCKIQTSNNNNQMLGKSVFMGDSTNPNKPSIEVIEESYNPEGEEKNVSFSQEAMFNDISERNNILMQKMKESRNPNMKLLFGHEIRLNNIEHEIIVLNDIKCTQVRDSQLEKEHETQYNHMIENIEQLSKNDMEKHHIIENMKTDFEKTNEKLISHVNEANEKEILYNEKFSEYQQKIDNSKMETKKIFEKQQRKIEELEEKNVNLQVSISIMKNILKKILESDETNKEDMVNELQDI